MGDFKLKLEDFQTFPFKNVQEYISDKEKAIKFSFLLQGDAPDRSELIKLIYKDIFEWYDDKVHSGDTLITYRTAILRKYYGKPYSKLSRDKQHEILNIIKSYTEHNDDFPFEFELDSKEKKVYQICNNYQIGNFGIFPKKGGINPKRAQSPYYDYFDLALSEIRNLYDGTLTPDDDFKEAILDEKEYFDQFKDFETFLSENFLTVFFDEGHLIRLSEIDNFEEYVRISNQIIYNRGLAILTYLQSRYDDNSEVPAQKLE